jgi:heme oxygenase (biliverdin-IX-beta and delta-forming)
MATGLNKRLRAKTGIITFNNIVVETTSTIAELIKSETAPAHAKTEKAMIGHIKAIQSKEDYIHLLSCMYAFYAPLEAGFETLVAPVLPDYAERRKADRLLQDIQTLGGVAPQQLATTLPVMQQWEEALGCFYVLEGSILGGAVIKKIIQGQCDAIPAEAFAFFSGYGQQNGSMWKQFLAQFNELVTTEQQKAAAVQAANDCFTQFEKSIKGYYSTLAE